MVPYECMKLCWADLDVSDYGSFLVIISPVSNCHTGGSPLGQT